MVANTKTKSPARNKALWVETRITSNKVFVEAVTLVGTDIVVRQNWSQKFERL